MSEGTVRGRFLCWIGSHEMCWIGICHRPNCVRGHLPGVDLNGHPRPATESTGDSAEHS